MRFLLAASLTALCFFIDGGTDLTAAMRSEAILEWDVMYFVFMAFHYGLYHNMYFVFAMLPKGLQFCEEWDSGMFFAVIKRYGKKGYAKRILLQGALSGGCAVAIGFLVYVASLSMVFPLFSEHAINANFYLQLPLGSLLQEVNAGVYFIVRSYYLFLNVTLFTACAIYVSLYIPNKSVALVSGFFGYRVIKLMGDMLKVPEALRITHLLSGNIIIKNEMVSVAVISLLVILVLVGLCKSAEKVLIKRCESGNI